jgi:hypothetical protein
MVTAAGVAALLLLFPPFMVIDRAAAGTRHAALGHHPSWRPPTADQAERVLSAISAPQGGHPSLEIGVNRVRLVLELGATAVCAFVALALQTGFQRRQR